MSCIFPHSFKAFNKEDIEQSISGRFEQQATTTPKATAISFQQQITTYEQLNLKANQIARAIRVCIKDTNQPAALMMGQGSLLVAAILGILKSCNFYVPLDCRQPLNLLEPMVGELKPAVIIYDAEHGAIAKKFSNQCSLIDISETDLSSGKNLREKPSPGSMAYLYFTSGSTGKPKGVMDNHRNVLHNVMRYTNTLGFAPGDRLSLIQHCSFSGAVSSMFGALTNGATLCPCDVATHGVQILPSWIEQEGITIFHSVPSVFRYLATAGGNYDSIRIVRLEGDRSTPEDGKLFQQNFGDHCTLVNGLGATECGLVRQYFLNRHDPIESMLPIGYAVKDMQVLISDEQGSPLPSGEIGEIRVKSNYLALGYWSDPQKTANSFLFDRDGSRVYKTGDLGRMDRHQCLEHLGRKDDQLKIRGNTVNLTELEGQIAAISGVSLVAVKDFLDNYRERQLAAYVVSRQPGNLTEAGLRGQLIKQLPKHMVPAIIRIVDNLPVTENGKVDRKSLPDPNFDRTSVQIPVELPRTATEKLLASIWSEVLEIDQVGIKDDFLSLGGDSLKAARVINQLKKHRIQLSIVSLFEYSVLGLLANYLQNEESQDQRLSRIDQRAYLQRSSLNSGSN